MRAIKRLIPWWAKMAGKVALSRVPLQYRLWQRMNLFVHGQMDRPEYAVRVVRSHLERVGWPDLQRRTVLELGPGDALATAVIAKALGAQRTLLVDSGPFATCEALAYQTLARYLQRIGLRPPNLENCTSVDEVLLRCDATYLTRGLDDLKALPTGLVDLVFSQAVLEHIRRDTLEATLWETRRIAAGDGIASHQVDLRDHLGAALNNLRFEDATWEADWMARSGFYTNRVRFSEMLAMFAAAGWHCEVTDVQKWPRLPTPRGRLARRFRDLPDEDLRVAQFDVVARKA